MAHPQIMHCDMRTSVHVPGTTQFTYGSDTSTTVRYDFNAAGFRSEDYDPDAQFRLCVFGESNAFGTGLAYEGTFGARLKIHLGDALGLEPRAVNYLNFAVGAASADFCVRTLHRQPVVRQADLVIMNYPKLDRVEYSDGQTHVSYSVSSVNEDNLVSAPDALTGFCEFYTEPLGHVNYVKNILLAQGLLRDYGVDHIQVCQHLPRDRADFAPDFLPMIDERRTLRHRLFRDLRDLAADGMHPGARCHAALEIDLLAVYGRMLTEQGSPVKGNKISAHANHLRRTSSDWAFCHARPGNSPSAPPSAPPSAQRRLE